MVEKKSKQEKEKMEIKRTNTMVNFLQIKLIDVATFWAHIYV